MLYVYVYRTHSISSDQFHRIRCLRLTHHLVCDNMWWRSDWRSPPPQCCRHRWWWRIIYGRHFYILHQILLVLLAVVVFVFVGSGPSSMGKDNCICRCYHHLCACVSLTQSPILSVDLWCAESSAASRQNSEQKNTALDMILWATQASAIIVYHFISQPGRKSAENKNVALVNNASEADMFHRFCPQVPLRAVSSQPHFDRQWVSTCMIFTIDLWIAENPSTKPNSSFSAFGEVDGNFVPEIRHSDDRLLQRPQQPWAIAEKGYEMAAFEPTIFPGAAVRLDETLSALFSCTYIRFRTAHISPNKLYFPNLATQSNGIIFLFNFNFYAVIYIF